MLGIIEKVSEINQLLDYKLINHLIQVWINLINLKLVKLIKVTNSSVKKSEIPVGD